MLTLQHVGQRLERTVTRSGHGATTTTIVEQCVHCFLQHALFVVDDDFGCTETEQTLEAVVAVDHATVQVVEVGGCETSTFKLNHRTQFGRDHRNNIKDHGLRIILTTTSFGVALVERSNNLETLNGLLLTLCAQWLLTVLRNDCFAQLDFFFVKVDAIDE